MPRDVLPPQVERDGAADERGRDGGRGGAVGGAGEGVGPEVPLGADLREQGRRHGVLQPAPALPDLGRVVGSCCLLRDVVVDFYARG